MDIRVVVGAVAVAAIAGHVCADTFTDEAAWRDAVSNVYLVDDFESYPSFTTLGDLALLGLTIDSLSEGGLATVRGINEVGGFSSSGINVLLNGPNFPGNGYMTIRNTDGSPLFALGYWNTGADDRSVLVFHRADGSVIDLINTPDVQNNFSFQGIVSSEPAAFATISATAGNGWFSIDDIQTSSIPAPGASAVLLAAAGLGLNRRRR